MSGGKYEWLNATNMPPVLWVEGVTNSVSPCDVELKLEYDETPEGDNSGLFKCADRVRLTVVRVELTKMTFGMGWNLMSDSGRTYPTLHWTATNSSPYLYQRNKHMNATATFKVEPTIYTGYITLSGDGPGDLDFTNTTVAVAGGLAIYPATDTIGVLTNSVNFWNPLQINWKYGVGSTATTDAGQTSNQVYVALANPSGLSLYHTVVHLACSYGNALLIKDWIFSVTPSYPAEPNYKWKITLVTEQDGSMGMVPAPAGRIYADLTKLTTLTGQNSAPPSEEFFGRHFIVRYGGLYYDPSYGRTYTNATDFENKAVGGYAVQDTGPDYKVKHATGLGNMSFNP